MNLLAINPTIESVLHKKLNDFICLCLLGRLILKSMDTKRTKNLGIFAGTELT